MTRLEFVQNFFEEIKINGLSQAALGATTAGEFFISEIIDYEISQFSYEKVTKKTKDIPRIVEDVISENKFNVLLGSDKKIKVFVIGENEAEFKIISQ